ncbi:MAG: hypothetical protein MUC40_07200 [Akkermansiaceae bacterium]|nr:hypothetical protein [Akkermansiaceae bacterium]
MVPHETVEAAVNKVLGLDAESERRIAIVGVPDEQKGEAIVLLSTIAGPALEQECIDLRYKLLDEGLSSLWCPKHIIPVTEIPVLASGKLDILMPLPPDDEADARSDLAQPQAGSLMLCVSRNYVLWDEGR